MPSQPRTSSRRKAQTPSKSFDPYPSKKMTTRNNRSVKYREVDSESDSDDDVMYLGQRTKKQSELGLPVQAQPKITIGEEEDEDDDGEEEEEHDDYEEEDEDIDQPKVKKVKDDVKAPEPIESDFMIQIRARYSSYVVRPFSTRFDTEVAAVEEKEQLPQAKLSVQEKGRAIFQTLPYEIHQNIVSFLEHDADVIKYAKLCRQAKDAISCSVWRMRFAETFDMPERNLDPLALAKKYAYRRDVADWICFDIKKYGGAVSRQIKVIQDANTRKCLAVLRDLIIESNARKVVDADGNARIVGLNHEYIRNWVSHDKGSHTDIIDAIINTAQTSWDDDDIVTANSNGALVLVIQLCLTSISLHPDTCNATVSHFDMSQREVYADTKKQPLFLGAWKQDINVRWLLHTVNFFKMHLKASNGEGLLAQQYEDLESDQLPQPWVGRIKAGTQPLGRHWKSAYTFLEDNNTLLKLRKYGNEDEPMVDEGELFSDLMIFFDDAKFAAGNWPQAFERLVKSNPYRGTSPQQTRQTRSANANPVSDTQYELKTFYGTSRGANGAHFYGRIHALPRQQGITGFQRVSLVKFYTTDEGEYDPCNVWAYEGCVLPGGRIIVGRWWDVTTESRDPVEVFGGPFIWWNVEGSAAEESISSEKALEFLDSIHDVGFA